MRVFESKEDRNGNMTIIYKRIGRDSKNIPLYVIHSQDKNLDGLELKTIRQVEAVKKSLQAWNNK